MRTIRKPCPSAPRSKASWRAPAERPPLAGRILPEPAPTPLTVIESLGAIRRHWLRSVLATAAASLLGLVYVAVAPRYFAATAMLIVDPRSGQSFQQGGQIAMTVDSAYVDSQVEILRSDAMALSVVQSIPLDEKAPAEEVRSKLLPPLLTDFAPKIASLGFAEITQIGNRLADYLPFRAEPDDAAATSGDTKAEKALADYRRAVQVRRVGLTYIIEVTCKSRNAELAAQIANATTESYIRGQLEAKRSASLEAILWLTDRVKDLQEETMAAEGAVTDFKVSGSSQDRASLKALEIRGQTYRTIYETFLGRLAAARQEPFAIAETRIISKALPPTKPTTPPPLLLISAIAATACALTCAATVLLSRLPRDPLGLRA